MYSPAVATLMGDGAKAYALKEFDTAASHYADACGLFSEENGHDDASLLLLYGKALFQNAVAHSGVLGGVGGDEPQKAEEEDGDFHFEEGMAAGENDAGHEDDESEDGAENEKENGENDNDSDGGDNDSDGGDEGGQAEEQSDFEAAWDILDIARALLEQKKEELSENTKAITQPYTLSSEAEAHAEFIATLEKLHETYDLLGEVSLESENFAQAARDLTSCLELRQALYPETSPLISESHYKLSLALEFCVEDPQSRQQAADHMQAAIQNVQKRAQAETDDQKKKEDHELLVDLKERFEELKKAPVDEIESQQMDMIKGLLGEAVAGATGAPAAEKRKVPVNDLSSMVVKKKRPAPKK